MIFNENGENLITVNNKCVLLEKFISDEFDKNSEELIKLTNDLNSILDPNDMKKIYDLTPHNKFIKGINICSNIIRVMKVIGLSSGVIGIISAIFKKSTIAIISFCTLAGAILTGLIANFGRLSYKEKDKECLMKNTEEIISVLQELSSINKGTEYVNKIQNQINLIKDCLNTLKQIEINIKNDTEEIDQCINRYKLRELHKKTFPISDKVIPKPTVDNPDANTIIKKRDYGAVGVITKIIDDKGSIVTAECVVYGDTFKKNSNVTFSYNKDFTISDIIPYNRSSSVDVVTTPNKIKATFIANTFYKISVHDIFIIRT